MSFFDLTFGQNNAKTRHASLHTLCLFVFFFIVLLSCSSCSVLSYVCCCLVCVVVLVLYISCHLCLVITGMNNLCFYVFYFRANKTEIRHSSFRNLLSYFCCSFAPFVFCYYCCEAGTVMTPTRTNTLQCAAATRCYTMQHATRCSTLYHVVARCNTLQCTASFCNTLQHTATRITPIPTPSPPVLYSPNSLHPHSRSQHLHLLLHSSY